MLVHMPPGTGEPSPTEEEVEEVEEVRQVSAGALEQALPAGRLAPIGLPCCSPLPPAPLTE